MTTTRRDFISLLASGVAVVALPSACQATPRGRLSLGFSLYGMKSLPIERALSECARIGYDNVEVSLIAGFPTEPAMLSPALRTSIRHQAAANRIQISSLLANLSLVGDERTHASHLETLRIAAGFAREFGPGQMPVIQTVMGGKPAEWDQSKGQMAARLRDWDSIAREYGVTLTVKGHVSGAVDRPERLLWILREAAGTNLAVAYDHAHYKLGGISYQDSLPPLVAQTQFVHVKEATGGPDNFRFLLPGEGDSDFRGLFRMLVDSGYNGPVVAEVSSQIFNRPGYDPIAAAEKCHAALAPAVAAA